MKQVDPHDESTYRQIVICSDPKDTRLPKERIIDEAVAKGFTTDDAFALKLALEESLTNAVKHGNRLDPKKCVTVRYAITREEAIIIIRDEGCGFCLEDVPDPTSPDRLPVPSGRGIMLIKAYMDDVSYRDEGREVRFVKKRGSKPQAE